MELIQEIKKFVVATEEAALEAIDDFRNRAISENFEVAAAKYTRKDKKSKGEIIDTWYIVEVNIKYAE